MPETTPNLGLQAPLGSEPISQGDDLMRANNPILDTAIHRLRVGQPGDPATHGFRIWAGAVTTDANGYALVPMTSIGIDNTAGDVRLWVSLEFSKASTGGVAGDQPHWAAVRSIGTEAEVVIYSMQRSGAEVDQLTSRYGGKSANVTILAYGRVL